MWEAGPTLLDTGPSYSSAIESPAPPPSPGAGGELTETVHAAGTILPAKQWEQKVKAGALLGTSAPQTQPLPQATVGTSAVTQPAPNWKIFSYCFTPGAG